MEITLYFKTFFDFLRFVFFFLRKKANAKIYKQIALYELNN